MPEAADSSNPAAPFGEAFRRIQEIGAQLSDAARTMADDFARTPGGRFAEPMIRLGSQTAELATLWVAPVRAVLQEQQELMDAMATWAQQQRELAERFSVLAERHRQLTTQVTTLLDPWLEQIGKVGQWNQPEGADTEDSAGRRPSDSPALDQVLAPGGWLVGLGPEVGDLGDAAPLDLEEGDGEGGFAVEGPAEEQAAVVLVPEDDDRLDVPVARELGVEGDVPLAAPDPLPGLRDLVDHVRVEEVAERGPVAPFQPVGEGADEGPAVHHAAGQ